VSGGGTTTALSNCNGPFDSDPLPLQAPISSIGRGSHRRRQGRSQHYRSLERKASSLGTGGLLDARLLDHHTRGRHGACRHLAYRAVFSDTMTDLIQRTTVAAVLAGVHQVGACVVAVYDQDTGVCEVAAQVSSQNRRSLHLDCE
jgi:hypothetical protein